MSNLWLTSGEIGQQGVVPILSLKCFAEAGLQY